MGSWKYGFNALLLILNIKCAFDNQPLSSDNFRKEQNLQDDVHAEAGQTKIALCNYLVSFHFILLQFYNEDKDDSDGDGDDEAGFSEEGREGSSRDSPQGGSRFQWKGEFFLQQLETFFQNKSR